MRYRTLLKRIIALSLGTAAAVAVSVVLPGPATAAPIIADGAPNAVHGNFIVVRCC